MYKIISVPCVPVSLCGFKAVNYELWGNPSGKLIGVMGESPYKDEVRLGRPFIGRSGQLLRRVLDNDKFQFLIFNSVACMPIDSKGVAYKPTPIMVERCKLNRRVAYNLLPKGTLIVLLGRFAINTVFNDNKMPFGIFAEKDGYTYYTAYHPSWALRGYSNFDKFVEILKRVNIVRPEYY